MFSSPMGACFRGRLCGAMISVESKSNLHYTLGITRKRVTSGGDHPAARRLCYTETPQR